MIVFIIAYGLVIGEEFLRLRKSKPVLVSAGMYTFFAPLRWSWAIGLGYMASIWVHFLMNVKHSSHNIITFPNELL